MVSVIIPTYNAARHLPALLDRLADQTIPYELIIIDSSSKDETPQILKERGIAFHTISSASFNHGGTRNMGIRMARYDQIIFLTQDALPTAANTLELLVKALNSRPDVALAYGRQLPYPDTHVFGAFARLINYPDQSRIKTRVDIPELGIRTCSCSNSFAAYKKEDILALGGFPDDSIFGEDVSVSSQFILNGKAIAYCAEAQVYHSHDYTIGEEFRRYFDIGVFHEQQQRFLREFTQAESQGIKYMTDEARYLLRTGNAHLLPAQFVRLVAKYVGYRAGRSHEKLPVGIKKKWSMSKTYWK
ncbi:glycosyltransferase family 2 protein [Tellurirhabdus bombi]|uniref:glycosyltransferase family 2 protein n=1 Tax=Tellurirhabdus bombi TaxID=2907205 RepID=UPI001F285D75|nr:glycosyltransferase [Tellurirhabdus bombi]